MDFKEFCQYLINMDEKGLITVKEATVKAKEWTYTFRDGEATITVSNKEDVEDIRATF